MVTYRIAELIRHGIAPERILAVTFTNKAADEMQQRAAALLGKRLPKQPEISTFHSLCVRILRRHIRHLGYPAAFAIYDRGDQESVARSRPARDQGGRRPAAAGRPALLHRPLEDGLGPARSRRPPLAQTDKEHLAAAAYRRYQKRPEGRRGASISTTCCCAPRSCSSGFPRSARAEAGRFDHLLVDEYQDTNGSQYRIVKALAAGHRNLCVVGDDDQSIYGWRGAEVTHILRFTARLARRQDRPPGDQLPLDPRDPRLGQPADRLQPAAARQGAAGDLPTASRRGSCNCDDEARRPRPWSTRSPARIDRSKRRPRDFAILCRTNEQPRAFEMELRRAKIPYVLVGGMSFYDRKEVRDMLAYLKLLVNPRDEVSLLRIINTPPRGIGQTDRDAADGGGRRPRASRCGTCCRRRRPGAGRGRRAIDSSAA